MGYTLCQGCRALFRSNATAGHVDAGPAADLDLREGLLFCRGRRQTGLHGEHSLVYSSTFFSATPPSPISLYITSTQPNFFSDPLSVGCSSGARQNGEWGAGSGSSPEGKVASQEQRPRWRRSPWSSRNCWSPHAERLCKMSPWKGVSWRHEAEGEAAPFPVPLHPSSLRGTRPSGVQHGIVGL